jgi:hypothetical protein
MFLQEVTPQYLWREFPAYEVKDESFDGIFAKGAY